MESEFSCRKHPSVSVVGVCPYCLNDRLVSLVCVQCGEQRFSTCSCSDFSPDQTSNVVRISSLIDEETMKQRKTVTEKSRRIEEVVVLKRSSSSCVEIKRKNHRFSKIGRFFRNINVKKNRDCGIDEKINDYNDGKKLGVSRSRSLCSFRGNGYFIGSEEDRSSYSGARSSSVNGGLMFGETEHRKSNFEGRKSNYSETTENRKSNFSESEPPRRSCFEARKSNFSETEYSRRSNFSETEYNRRGVPATATRMRNFNEEQYRKSDSAAMNFTRRVLSMKESYFTGGEETGFIDLKFDSSGGAEVVVNERVLERGGGGSCREVSKSRRSFKGWKWLFRHHHLHHHHRDS